MNVSQLPTLNALLNLSAAVMLAAGFYHIKQGRQIVHKRFMIAALLFSAIFLVSYLIYHNEVGSIPYPKYDWTRAVYFAILIPHIILAAVMSPFIIVMVFFALKGEFFKHKRFAKWMWPIWMFVSISGVLVYLMLYRF